MLDILNMLCTVQVAHGLHTGLHSMQLTIETHVIQALMQGHEFNNSTHQCKF